MSSAPPTDAPSDELLRTLASVPVSTPMLNLGCDSGRHAQALLRLGFPMHACDPRAEMVEATRAVVRELVDDETARSCIQQTSRQGLDDLEATFDWVIAARPEAYLDAPADLEPLLQQVYPLLNPGGWLYLTLPAVPPEEGQEDAQGLDDVAMLFSPSDLDVPTFDTPFMEVQSPERVEANGELRLHALYRRVDQPAPG